MYRMPTVNQTWIAYPKVNDNCYHAPNYLVCTTYQTLVILMNGYYPIIETLVLRLTDWPNFMVAVLGAVCLLGIACGLVKDILSLIF